MNNMMNVWNHARMELNAQNVLKILENLWTIVRVNQTVQVNDLFSIFCSSSRTVTSRRFFTNIQIPEIPPDTFFDIFCKSPGVTTVSDNFSLDDCPCPSFDCTLLDEPVAETCQDPAQNTNATQCSEQCYKLLQSRTSSRGPRFFYFRF